MRGSSQGTAQGQLQLNRKLLCTQEGRRVGRREEKGEEGGLGGCVVLALGGLWYWFGFRTLAVWGLDSDITATWSCSLVGTGIRWLQIIKTSFF